MLHPGASKGQIERESEDEGEIAVSKEATHGASGCQEPKDTFPDFCQGMAEKTASFGPVMEQMMARCMEKMKRETPYGEGTEPTKA